MQAQIYMELSIILQKYSEIPALTENSCF